MRFILDTTLRLALKLGIYICKGSKENNIMDVVELFRPISDVPKLKRIGNQLGDGGYLLPDDLLNPKVDFLFSPGVGQETFFDTTFAQAGIKVFMADGSVDPPEDVLLTPNLFFDKVYVGSTTTTNVININDWINSNKKSDSEFILQMDIEGGEYECILALDQDLMQQMRIGIIEFHNLEDISTRTGYVLVRETLRKIRKLHDIVHIHPNNCKKLFDLSGIQVPTALEVTFIRRDRLSRFKEKVPAGPALLDRKVVLRKRDVSLPEYWWKDQ